MNHDFALQTYLSKLKNNLDARTQAVQHYTDEIHSILTPEQSLKYMRWVDDNHERVQAQVDKSETMSSSGTSQ